MFLDRLFAQRVTTPANPARHYFLPVRSTSGVHVDEDTALTFSAVFAATKAISETVALLPWRVFRDEGESRVMQPRNPVDVLLHKRPNEDMTAFSFREYMIATALLWGNAYAEIERSGSGAVRALHPIPAARVTPDRTDQGRLIYRVQNEAAAETVIPARQMFHLRGPTQDGVHGRSVISLARDSFGIGIAADKFSGAFLGNGGTPSLVIMQDEGAPDLSPEGARNMLASFDRRHKGPTNAGKTAYLERGFKLEPVGVPQKDAQFIEQRKHSVQEVARWFRVPPHKIASMEAATFSNIEQQSIEFVTDAIQPWVERMEQEANIKLLRDDTLFTKMNINGLLRGDSAARSEYYSKLWNIGVLSVNDIRRFEDQNPVPDGDRRFVPLNVAPLENAGEAAEADAPPPNRGADALFGVVLDAHRRMIDKETNAAQRALAKGRDMGEWCAEFYERHAAQMRDALRPGAVALGELYSIDADRCERIIENHVAVHCDLSKSSATPEGVDNWKSRADYGARRLTAAVVGGWM